MSMLSPLRRVTVFVSDIEASLAFYRDTLGLQVSADHVITAPEEGLMLGLPGAKVRVVSWQAAGSDIGIVGLLEIREPKLPPRRPVREAVGAPDAALIFVTESIARVHERVRAAGAPIQAAPLEYAIPQRGICAGMSCHDPNGLLVEITQFAPRAAVR